MPSVARGSCILVCPGDLFGYGGIEKGWIEDFITFTGPRADQLRSAGLIRTGIYPSLNLLEIQKIIDVVVLPDTASQLMPDCGQAIFGDLHWAAESSCFSTQKSQFEGLKANSLLQLLLLELGQTEIEAGNALEQRIRHLLHEISATPDKWWTVSEMAEYCGVSQVHLRRVFKRLTGTPPKRYLERIKMGVAAKMICQSTTLIADIALHLDYHDPYHFSRRFKIVMGVSPQQYRLQYQELGE